MRTKKYEIARAIDKLKSVVQKNDIKPALSGILVKDGRLISSNGEITIHIKFDDANGESFIIPMKAFDLIRNLPEGDVEIKVDDKNIVTIQTDAIRNSYQSYPTEGFLYQDIPKDKTACVRLPGEKLMNCIGHVMCAAADKHSNKTWTGIYFDGDDKGFNVVALNGYVLAWDRIDTGVENNIGFIVPKTAARKLLDMGMLDDVEISYDKNFITFQTDEYIIYSRLIEGKYYPYASMFKECPIYTIVNKKQLADSMTRAKMCVRDEAPTVFNLEGNEMKISLNDKETHYEEHLPMQEAVEQPLKIGFSSRLVLDTIRAFTCENITLNFASENMPMIVEAEDSDMKVLVLPVKIREA